MKNLILAFMILTSVITRAQNNNDMTNTIQITGAVRYEKVVTKYRANVMISLDQLYYSDQSYCTLDELKSKYFDKLKSVGILERDFTENKLSYLTSGYQKDGTVLKYETTSKDELLKLTSVKVTGVIVNTVEYMLVADDITKDKLRVEALENARLNAAKLAKVTGKQLGEIKSISEDSTSYDYWVSYLGNDEYYSLRVTFEMK